MPSASPGPTLSASLSGCFYARATLILPEQKQTAKSEKGKPIEAHCLSRMHRLLSAASRRAGCLPRLPLAPGLEEIAQHTSSLPCHPQIPRHPNPEQQKSHWTPSFSLGPLVQYPAAWCWLLCARGVRAGTRGAVELRTTAGSILSQALAYSSQLQ